jgi:hypothetical protein
MKRLLRIFGPCLVLALGATIYWAPTLIHAMDHGLARVSLADLEAGKLPTDTRNLVVTGVQPGTTFVTVDQKEDGRSTSDPLMYVPLLLPGDRPSGRVKVVVEDHYANYSDYAGRHQPSSDHDLLAGALDEGPPTEVQGTVRNVLWEGIDHPDDVSKRFAEGGILLDADPILLDAADRVIDQRFAGIAIGAAALLGLLIGLALDGEARKRARAAAAGST